jgi:hypothetical protein
MAHSNAVDGYAKGALLVERRRIVITIDEGQNEVAVDWQSEFEVGPAAARVTLTGTAYNGLGMRLPREFDHVARHQNSENLPYTTDAKWDVTRAKWSAVSGAADGREVSVALFDTPGNKGEARFFTMLNPFAYLSVTQNLEKQPMAYARRQKFRVRYLLTLYSKAKSAEFLNRRCAQWLEEAK